MFARLLVYASYAFMFVFCTLCLACGLYYIAELVEEFSKLARKCITYTIYIVVAIHVLVGVFEPIPLLYIALGLVAHGFYYSLLVDFP